MGAPRKRSPPNARAAPGILRPLVQCTEGGVSGAPARIQPGACAGPSPPCQVRGLPGPWTHCPHQSPSWTQLRPASGGRHRVPVVVAVSLAQGQRQRQAGLPFQVLLLRAVLRGPSFEEVGDVPDLAEKREVGAAWVGTRQARQAGHSGAGEPRS